SACISVIVYTCTCMPGLDEDGDSCGDTFGPDLIFANNGYHHNLTSPDKDDHHNITSSVNASVEYLIQNLTALLPALSTTPAAQLLQILTDITIAKNETLVSVLDMMTSVVNDTSRFLSKSSQDLFPESLSTALYQTDPGSSPILDPPHTNRSSPASDILDSYLNSIFQTADNLTDHRNDTVTMSTSNALPSTRSPNSSFNSSARNDSAVNNNDWPHLVDAVLVNLTERVSLQDMTSNTQGYYPDLSVILANESSSVVPNTQNACQKPFILLRTDLKRTQILDSMGLDDLIQLTFYGQGVGVILGSAVGSMTADILGRRRLLYIALTGMLTMQCLLAVSISWVMFIFMRTLAVAFAGATMVVSSVLVIEFLGPDWRDACTCSCFWTFGAIVMAMETLVTLNWRWLALLSGGVCFPLIGTYFTSTESVRWLQCQHRFTEAEACFREVVSVNASAVPDIMSLLDESRACIIHNMHQKRFTFLDLFHSLDSAKWTVTLIYTSMVSACVYFCLLLRVKQITGLVHFDVFLPFILDLPLTWSVIVVNRCLGRRWCLFLYSVASGFALLSVLILHVTGNVGQMPSLVTGLALFGKIGVTASLSLIFLIAIETFPTVTR
ncbi:solute carrier family 22 member 4, partial [Biomphalaria glabrata]